LPQPRKIITSNGHGPRNSHRSRVLRGPLEPKPGGARNARQAAAYKAPGARTARQAAAHHAAGTRTTRHKAAGTRTARQAPAQRGRRRLTE
ncbi:hypothetical protein ACI2LW_32080, partial [Streptomyces sp. NPDC004065]